MDIYEVKVPVEDREIVVLVRPGVMATVETGSHNDKVESPEHRVNVLVGNGLNGVAAWVQISKYDDGQGFTLEYEGWVQNDNRNVGTLSGIDGLNATLSLVADPSPETLKCQETASFGETACCTAYGNNCYVRCCNGCCSDPRRCPGASCCA